MEQATARAVAWAQLARSAILQAQESQMRYTNRWHCDLHFAVGDRILLSLRNLTLESSRKLAQRWLGPFEVEERIGTTAYRLRLTGRVETLHPVFHVLLLRPWTGHLP